MADVLSTYAILSREQGQQHVTSGCNTYVLYNWQAIPVGVHAKQVARPQENKKYKACSLHSKATMINFTLSKHINLNYLCTLTCGRGSSAGGRTGKSGVLPAQDVCGTIFLVSVLPA